MGKIASFTVLMKINQYNMKKLAVTFKSHRNCRQWCSERPSMCRKEREGWKLQMPF